MRQPVLEVEGLTKHFPIRGGFFGGSAATVRAVDGVSFSVERGRSLGLVGESGCGKTTTAKLILKLEEPTSGVIRFEGRELNGLDAAGVRGYRRGVTTRGENGKHEPAHAGMVPRAGYQ